MADPRVGELLDWSQETQLPLPYPIEDILELENQGHVVDLETGEVGFYEADLPLEIEVEAA